MSKQAKSDAMNPFTLEEALAQHYQVEPSAAFLEALEQKLLAQPARRAPAAPSPAAPSFWQTLAAFFRPRPALVAALLLLILLVPLLIIGPQRAWAGLQAWLGYVPGVGFVDLENTRVLLAPAAQTRDGVTLRVTEAIAGPQETTLVIESSGLPPEDVLWDNEGAQVDDSFTPVLRLPDGTALNIQTFTLRLGRGTFIFPPLPPDVFHLTLELPLLPLVPPGAAPQNWSLPLLLQPATGELVGAMYPQPYSPADASDTHHGVTLSVLEVAHTPQQTVFTVQTQWQDESWAYAHPQPAYHSLYDDVGHIYGDYVEPGSSAVTTMVQRVQPDEAPPPQTSQRTFDFGPLSLAAGKLTFAVPEVEVMLPATDTFDIDLGQQPQVGDSWDMDVHLSIAGFPVHITRAWIGAEQIGPRGDREQRTNLYFYLQPVAPQAHRRLLSFGLTTANPAFQGSGGSGLQLRHLTLAQGAQLPSGQLTVQVTGASVALSGPWTLTWDVPDAPTLVPTHLEPNQVATANGVSLRLDQVALTDRVTAVALTLEDAPTGAALADVLPGIPGERQRRLVLEDDRLHDYWFEGGSWLWWQPQGPAALSAPPGPHKWLPFPPLQPLARRLTLQIPTLLLARPDPATFTFTVADPQSLTFTPDPQGNGGQRSEAWPIDVRVALAGYDIHFTEAALFENGPGNTNIDLTGLVTSADGRPPLLHELRVSAIAGPDGALLHGAAPSGATLSSLPTGVHSLARCDGRRDTCEVSLMFPIHNADTGLVVPGSYEVMLEGVNELVQGPWTFQWSLHDTPDVDGAGPEK